MFDFLRIDSVSDWFDVHHRLQEDSPLLLPKTQVSGFFLLPGRCVSGAVPVANHWNAGGELWLCAFVQVSPVGVFLRQGNNASNEPLSGGKICIYIFWVILWTALIGVLKFGEILNVWLSYSINVASLSWEHHDIIYINLYNNRYKKY